MNLLQQQPDASLRVRARQLDQVARQAVLERDDWRQALDLFEQKLAIWREVGAGSDDDRHKLFYALHKDSRTQWVAQVLPGHGVGQWRSKEEPPRVERPRKGKRFEPVPLRRAQ